MQFSTFTFTQQHNVRAFEQNGLTWFVAADVCAALEIVNHKDAISKLDDDEKAEAEIQTAGGKQTVRIINESGLYILILRSRKAMEKGTVQHKFRKWVTNEVLPTIRKTGSYTPKITSAQKQQIQAAVNARVHRTGQSHQAVYTLVHQIAQVASYHDIAAADFDKVMDCLHGEILDKETPPACPRNLPPLLHHAEYVFQWLMRHEPAIRLLNDNLAGNLIGRVRDGYCCVFDTAQQIGFTLQSHEYWRGYPFDGNYDTVCRYRELNAA